MKRKTTYLSITDSKIHFFENNQNYCQKFSNKIINLSLIKNDDKLYQLLKIFIKKNKINKGIMSNDLVILSNYKDKTNKELLTVIFNKLFFNKIKFISYEQLDKKIIKKEKILMLNIFNNNILLKDYNNLKLQNKIIINYKTFLNKKTLELNILKLVKKYIKKLNLNLKKIIIYGDSDNLKEIVKNLETNLNININYVDKYELLFNYLNTN